MGGKRELNFVQLLVRASAPTPTPSMMKNQNWNFKVFSRAGGGSLA